jgi:hypothetical protein
MRTALAFPFQYMQGLAEGQFLDIAEVWTNREGYGWELSGRVRANVHHRLTPPAPADPQDASAANLEFAEIHHSKDVPSKIGDRIKIRGQTWTVGDGNFFETYRTYTRVYAARPVSATPRQWIELRRYNTTTDDWELLPPQLVHVAWSKNQPDRLGGVAVRQYGWIFSPDDLPPLDVKQGDSFYFSGSDAVVTWVPPEPTDRREAIFAVNIGEGT